MAGLKKSILWLLQPKTVPALLITVTGTVFLIHIFMTGQNDTAFGYISYVVSAYTLAVWLTRFVRSMRGLRKWLHKTVFVDRFLSDRDYRAKLSVYAGLFINLGYAVFKLAESLVFRSEWLAATAVYYLALGFMRFMLMAGIRRMKKEEAVLPGRIRQLRRYRQTGWLMLLLNLSMAGMIVQMIWKNRSFYYPDWTIYASAAYTFYSVTVAVINVIKYRQMDSPLLSAAKMLGMAAALMSIFALQTSMLSQFGSDIACRHRMNILTGSCVCLLVLILAAYMIIRSGRQLDFLAGERS